MKGDWLTARWYTASAPFYLRPLSFLFSNIVNARRWLYRRNYLKTHHFNVPVIVVGNITVGGTGKTPLVIWLAQFLKQQGYQPGIVSRGYGGQAATYPRSVSADDLANIVGDEALLIRRQTECPVVVAPKRVAAVQKLLSESSVNIVISDDGLQHYALGRDCEIAVIDGERRLGNSYCLPAGPLREQALRLKEVDFIVNNGSSPKAGEYAMQLKPADLVNITTPSKRYSLADLSGRVVHAVAGIGYPERFFQLLRQLGATVMEHAFPDHYLFQAQDLPKGELIVMTEKDAVKCQAFADTRCWYLPVTAELDQSFGKHVLEKLR